MLDEHALQLRLSKKKQGRASVKRKRTDMESDSKKSAKLMVKNLAFEATRGDVRQLFGAYGRVRQLEVGLYGACFVVDTWNDVSGCTAEICSTPSQV